MYGAVPLRSIKKALLDCKAEGKLDRVKPARHGTPIRAGGFIVMPW